MDTQLLNGRHPDAIDLLEGGSLKRHMTLQGGEGPADASPSSSVPDPEVVERATRRRFTDTYKRSILEQADACGGRGEVGALLRREGLYYSTLANFQKQRATGLLDGGSSGKTRGAKGSLVAAVVAQKLELERENRKLRRQLARAEEIITIQKKAALLLGETLQDLQIAGED